MCGNVPPQIGGRNGISLFEHARAACKSVAYFLPRNTPPEQLAALAPPTETVEVEDHYLNRKLKTRIAYYGHLAEPHPSHHAAGGGAERSSEGDRCAGGVESEGGD